jgi:glucose/mannose-6-phosphate isomerase
VVIRDAEEHPRVAVRREALAAIAETRGVQWHEVVAEPGDAVERLAQLLMLVDLSSAYLALVQGADPDRRSTVTELHERTRR